MSHRTLRRAFAAACGIFIAGIAQAQTLTVEIELAMPISEDDLREALGGAPARFVARGATTTIETDTAGYKHLLANNGIRSVRVVGGTAAGSDARLTSATSFSISLTTIPRVSTRSRGMDLDAARTAMHRARLLARTPGTAVIRAPSEAGPGTLIVRGVTASGEEVSRAIVEDPRLIRLEVADHDGRFQSRRDLISTDAAFNVSLPSDPTIAQLTISEFAAGGERQIAQVPVR